MPKFNENIKEMAKQNTDFRREILTNGHSQIVPMSIEPGDEIGGGRSGSGVRERKGRSRPGRGKEPDP